MSIYTKRGDKGITDMARTRNISKSDDRIQLGGAVDELSSHIGLMLSMFGFVNSYDPQETVQFLETIQKNLQDKRRTGDSSGNRDRSSGRTL